MRQEARDRPQSDPVPLGHAMSLTPQPEKIEPRIFPVLFDLSQRSYLTLIPTSSSQPPTPLSSFTFFYTRHGHRTPPRRRSHSPHRSPRSRQGRPPQTPRRSWSRGLQDLPRKDHWEGVRRVLGTGELPFTHTLLWRVEADHGLSALRPLAISSTGTAPSPPSEQVVSRTATLSGSPKVDSTLLTTALTDGRTSTPTRSVFFVMASANLIGLPRFYSRSTDPCSISDGHYLGSRRAGPGS